MNRETRFFVIDDDPGARRMLVQIIEEENLGRVVGEADDGEGVESQVLSLAPDIVLVDLLMPGQDGIETVQNLKEQNFTGKFIMISQIENKDMVGEAYHVGVEFFIHKPINRVEVISVIERVKQALKLSRSLEQVKKTLLMLEDTNVVVSTGQKKESETAQKVLQIAGELGIVGEVGISDLVEAVLIIEEQGLTSDTPLKELFARIKAEYRRKGTKLSQDPRAIEKRLRRLITQAQENLASLGLEDYHNPVFEHYASRLFDFAEVRKKMRELEGKKPFSSKPRVSLKKFIWGIHNEIKIVK